MAELLPQQRLLLELIKMSGDIGVPDSDDGTILYKTLQEAKAAGWIKLSPFGAGIYKAEITDLGRTKVKDRREKRDKDTFAGDNKRRSQLA